MNASVTLSDLDDNRMAETLEMASAVLRMLRDEAFPSSLPAEDRVCVTLRGDGGASVQFSLPGLEAGDAPHGQFHIGRDGTLALVLPGRAGLMGMPGARMAWGPSGFEGGEGGEDLSPGLRDAPPQDWTEAEWKEVAGHIVAHAREVRDQVFHRRGEPTGDRRGALALARVAGSLGGQVETSGEGGEMVAYVSVAVGRDELCARVAWDAGADACEVRLPSPPAGQDDVPERLPKGDRLHVRFNGDTAEVRRRLHGLVEEWKPLLEAPGAGVPSP